MSTNYSFAVQTVRYAEFTVERKINNFNHEALDELLKWIVLPPSDEKDEPRMLGALLQRAEAKVRSDVFWRGPYATPRNEIYRAISEEALAEFARLIRAEAFNEYKAQNLA